MEEAGALEALALYVLAGLAGCMAAAVLEYTLAAIMRGR